MQALPAYRPVLLALAIVMTIACGSTTPTPTRSPARPPSATAAQEQTSSPSAQYLDAIGIDLNSMPGSTLRGTLDAFDNGDGNTTLRARLSTLQLHPWALYPSFDCAGMPAEDSQL